jgi:hypothetical protein
VCERDDQDVASPYCAKLLINDTLVASGRGVDEITAFFRLADTVHAQGLSDGSVLFMTTLTRDWSEYKRRTTER